MSDISKIKVSGVEYDIKDIQARGDLGNLGTRVTELEQHGGGSVPKPLTYDYMPEGYPTKSVQTTTLMEEQEIAFTSGGDVYSASLTNPLEIVNGQTYIVNWDGAEYECVCSIFNDTILVLGNLSIMGAGDDTGEPFVYAKFPNNNNGFNTLDPSASHTISVKTTVEAITPMAEEFLPTGVTAAAIENALTTADNARATAENAQATAENAQATANAAATKQNPVFTGSFSQNRKSGSNIGVCSHAEGNGTTASGGDSHAEGNETIASGDNSHAEGFNTIASGDNSHAEGYNTKAIDWCQHVQGTFNIEDSSGTYAHIVGNGKSDDVRSNAYTLDWAGNAWFAGTVEGDALIIPSSTIGSTKKFKITVDDTGTISATEVT